MNEWEGFKGTKWQKNIDVQSFILDNFKEYTSDSSFLVGISKKTSKVWNKCKKLLAKESISGILDIETFVLSGIDYFNEGYIDRSEEVIVGLQTDSPLRRLVNVHNSITESKNVVETYGYTLDKDLEEKFTAFRKTYDDVIKKIYTDDINKARNNYLLRGLPDSYERGHIIGDYRRLALYGADYLIKVKKQDLDNLSNIADLLVIQIREEINEQIRGLELTKKMASRYGFDVSKPASNAKEAIEWTYLAYLSTIKQNSGASMSIGRNTTFFDIYIERDIEKGILTEAEAQELIDQYIIKLRMVRQLRTEEFNKFFEGDNGIITETIAGMVDSEKSLVTKTSYRILNTLKNIDDSEYVNLIVLWSKNLPDSFKKFTTQLLLEKRSIQLENDDLLRSIYGSDYAISGSSYAVKLGKQLDFYGSSINLAKLLLYSINGGKDELTGELIIPNIEEITGEYLDCDVVLKEFDKVLKKAIKIYVDSLNIIHYVQDKYSYEGVTMAFIDTNIENTMSFGITGLSTVADSFFALQFGHVRVKRNNEGLTTAFDIEFDYPRFGNNEENVDTIATGLIKRINREIKKYPLYKNAVSRLSLNTYTSNIVYGIHTGATPDGRKEKMPFPFGVNASYSKDNNGALASMLSIAAISYKDYAQGGIPNSIFVDPSAFSTEENTKLENIEKIIETYFSSHGQHLGLNIIEKSTIEDAFNNPNKYANLVLNLYGYPVSFNKLSDDAKLELKQRIIYDKI